MDILRVDAQRHAAGSVDLVQLALLDGSGQLAPGLGFDSNIGTIEAATEICNSNFTEEPRLRHEIIGIIFVQQAFDFSFDFALRRLIGHRLGIIIAIKLAIKKLLVNNKETVHTLKSPHGHLLTHDIIIRRPVLEVIGGPETAQTHTPGGVKMAQPDLTGG